MKEIMKKIMKEYKKGTKIPIGENEVEVISELTRFKDFYAIYADITKKVDLNRSVHNF